jgi:cob(I)alamin adenosyltransferase
MVRLTRITTKTGDDGTTSLASGERRRKDDARIAAIGAVDETNAAIGLARLHTEGEMDALLAAIQNDLFDLGADLSLPATNAEETAEHPPLRITPEQVARLEAETERINARLQPLTSFVLPGGAPASAHLHLARTVARRAERMMVSLAAEEHVGAPALHYINRLSDFLFVAARERNDSGAADVLWVPGQGRG